MIPFHTLNSPYFFQTPNISILSSLESVYIHFLECIFQLSAHLINKLFIQLQPTRKLSYLMEAQACNSQRQPMVKLTTTLVVAAATTTTSVVLAINIFRTVTAVIMAKIHLITNNCNTTALAVARESYKTALHRTIPNIQTPRIITINNCHNTNNNNNPITTDHRPRITTN